MLIFVNGRLDMRVDLDDEELEMLIDFQESMARDADESGERDEAKNRRQRARDLIKLRRVAA